MLQSNLKKEAQGRSSQIGMTLLEIMIVLGIIGTMMAFLIPQVTAQLDKSRIKQTKIKINQIVQAVTNYQIDCGKYPPSLNSLTTADSDCSNWGPDPYMKKIPKDEWGKEFSYELNSGGYVIKSPGYKGKEISSDEMN